MPANPSGCVPAIVDGCALPFLTKTAPGRCVTGCGGCVWLTCDACCGNDSRPESRYSAQAKAIVTFAMVTVKDAGSYKSAFAKHAESAQANTPGVRSMFSFMEKDKPNVAMQVAWYDSPEVLASVPSDFLAELTATYAVDQAKDFVKVFGGWTNAVKPALSAAFPGVTVEYGTQGRGFIRDMDTYGPQGTPYANPPMIWISKRHVAPTTDPEVAASSFQKAADLQYECAPAFYGSYEFAASDDPGMIWSLRFFGDYMDGHIAHFPKVICSWIPARVLFTVLPNLAGAGVSGFPFAYSFSTQDDIDSAIKWNGGNKAYNQYTWEGGGLIGPKPNFMKK